MGKRGDNNTRQVNTNYCLCINIIEHECPICSVGDEREREGRVSSHNTACYPFDLTHHWVTPCASCYMYMYCTCTVYSPPTIKTHQQVCNHSVLCTCIALLMGFHLLYMHL